MNWAVVRTFPTFAGVGLGFAYALYAGFALLALLFVWRAVPETRGARSDEPPPMSPVR